MYKRQIGGHVIFLGVLFSNGETKTYQRAIYLQYPMGVAKSAQGSPPWKGILSGTVNLQKTISDWTDRLNSSGSVCIVSFSNLPVIYIRRQYSKEADPRSQSSSSSS